MQNEICLRSARKAVWGGAAVLLAATVIVTAGCEGALRGGTINWPDKPRTAPPIVVPAPVDTPMPVPAPVPDPTVPEWRPSRDELMNIRANFISLRDEHGRIMLSWFWPFLDRETQLEWNRVWRANGVTHIVLCPIAQYPGYWAAGGDVRWDAGRYAEFNRQALNDHLIPVNMYATGDGGSDEDIDLHFTDYDRALSERDLLRFVWRVPGFEVVGPGAGWPSRSLSKALQLLCADHSGPIGVHLQPERAVGSSHPLESDDPWQGDEPEFYRKHGGECVDSLLYQTPHGSKLLSGNEWEDRFIEILDRLGLGLRGWRKVGISFFEVNGYDFYHNQSTTDDATRLATRAKALCDERGVACTFGNGLPR